jgi:hypothetical protein
MECSVVIVNKTSIHCIFCNAIPGSHDSTGVSALYKYGAPYGEIHISEPLGLLLAGESVKELDWI